MSAALGFESQQQTLILRGELDRETLQPLWRQRDALMADKTAIDVAQLGAWTPPGWRCCCICRKSSASAA